MLFVMSAVEIKINLRLVRELNWLNFLNLINCFNILGKRIIFTSKKSQRIIRISKEEEIILKNKKNSNCKRLQQNPFCHESTSRNV